MQRESTTEDPGGTAAAVIGGAGCALFGLIAFGPVGAIVAGLISGIGTKHDCSKKVARELDEASLDNCDEVAKEWLSDSDHRSAEVSVTRLGGGIIPLPETRRHFYIQTPEDVSPESDE
jgi:hypothetical protein